MSWIKHAKAITKKRIRKLFQSTCLPFFKVFFGGFDVIIDY